MVRQRTGSYFDPEVAEAYLDLTDGLWPPDDDPVPLTEVLSCDPGTPVDDLPGDHRLAVCEALADFADLKSVRRGAHSHSVASLAGQAASHLGLATAEQEHLRRAGLVHDLGKIAVSYRLLQKADDDTRQPAVRAEQPRSPSRSACTPTMASASCPGSAPRRPGNRRRRPPRTPDGSGYPLGPAAQRMPITARLLAAADAWAERARHGPPDLTAEDGLDPACLAAPRSCTRPGIGDQRRRSRAEPVRPPLSPRELEVLRLLADGASNPDISKTLYISRRTAEHHVEHILAKLEVTSRTAAVAYALTHEVLS